MERGRIQHISYTYITLANNNINNKKREKKKRVSGTIEVDGDANLEWSIP